MHMVSYRWRRGRRGTEGGAYTWLSERESGERIKASDEGAGMGGVCVCVCALGELANMLEEGSTDGSNL
jgi:hypothetical protein